MKKPLPVRLASAPYFIGMLLVIAGCPASLAGPAKPGGSPDILPIHLSEDASVTYDYDIVYVRVPRPYPKAYSGINHLNQAGLHQLSPPGAALRLLHPNGEDESLVPVAEQESITDPMVSLDGDWVYFAKFHHMAAGSAHMSRLQSRAGSDLYKVHVPTRIVVRLTHQERSPNTGAVPEGEESHPRGVHNLAPCPMPGGKVVFVSDRNGYRGVREQTQPGLQLFVMDDDGRNVEMIGPMNLGTALHPTALKDGRVMFSSLETQGLRSDERWGIWAIHPDGTNWSPLTSALGSPPGQAVHFQAQRSDESIVVETYYQTGSTDGFGTYFTFPIRPPEGEAAFEPGAKRFAPKGITQLTNFANFADIRPNHVVGDVYNRIVMGNVTQPSGAPDNHLLTTWAVPGDLQDQQHPIYDAGIYLLKAGGPVDNPSQMRRVKNDPAFQEIWPRALVPYRRIYGVDEPKVLTHRNDGKASPHLPEGTPFGLVGSSSLYKRESFPNGVVKAGSVTATSIHANDRKRLWQELIDSRFGYPGNWGEQGADAGLYANSDIWGIRIVVMEPVSDVLFRKRRFFALGSNAEERLRILGEFPVRKFDGGEQPVDPDGNPDTSFLAKIPADVAWTFQTLDHNGMVLNMAQTWHQLRPGEVRNDCGGCHAHSQQATDFNKTAAALKNYEIWDLVKQTPLFTTKANNQSGARRDKADRTGLRFEKPATRDVEFYRDIKPILDRSCVNCHRSGGPLEDKHRLALDNYRPIDRDWVVPWAENIQLRKHLKLPHTYVRLTQYAWAFQSRRSPLVWKLYGKRLDGFDNDDLPSPKLDYHDHRDVLDWCHRRFNKKQDVDYTGSAMPPPEAIAGTFEAPDGKRIKVPPLSDEEKLTFVRWIDLGCPIDLAENAKDGWRLDEGRPTLAVTHPAAGSISGPFDRILLGMHDYGTGLDMPSFTVTANFTVDGIPPGRNLARQFRSLPDHRWEWKLATPIAALETGTLTVSIKDRQGNTSRIDRSFRIGEPAR